MKEKWEITDKIERRIFTIRGQKVMIDRDLAQLYEVELKRLNEAVKRNSERFPEDFMFKLTEDEWVILRSQFATAKKNMSKIRFLPYAFTEYGILMLSNVLNSTIAVSVSIQIIRVFNNLRKYVFDQPYGNSRIADLHKLFMLHIENNDNKFSEYDNAINEIINVLNNFIEKPPKSKQIGFTAQ